MIVSFPLVNERGIANGAEVTCRFSDIYALENLTRYVRQPRTLDDHLLPDDGDRYELVPGCVTIYTPRSEFTVQADYAELKQRLTDLNEWNEVE